MHINYYFICCLFLRVTQRVAGIQKSALTVCVLQIFGSANNLVTSLDCDMFYVFVLGFIHRHDFVSQK